MKRPSVVVFIFLLFTACGGSSAPPGDDTPDSGVTGERYPDADHDGFGDMTKGMPAATAPADYIATGGDCNDADAAIHPMAAEVCDHADNNCDGKIDDADPMVVVTTGSWFYRDADSDHYGDSTSSKQACAAPAGYVADATDCNDNNGAVHPSAVEVCDQVDNDCNGLTDDSDPALDLASATAFYRDADADGYGSISASAQYACVMPSGYVTDHTDCNDSDLLSHPGAIEICDGHDNDCDGGNDGTPAQPNQCTAYAGTFTGTYTHHTDERVGTTIINQMDCSGTGSGTVALTRSKALQGTFACHYSGSLGGFDTNQTVTLSATVDLSGHVTGTIDHMYDSFDSNHRVYTVTGTLSSSTLTLSGTGSWYPNAMSAVPWGVTFSFAASK
jgi:hypothetical protein